MRLGPTRRPARAHLRRTGVAATCVVLASTLAACGLDSGSGDDNDDEIVIGISLPLTGDFSEPGKGVQRGYEAWAEHVNENGGLLGKDVRLVILDDQSNADRVASDYERLINQEGADLIFGPFSTRLVVPAAQVAQDYGFLFVEPAGAADEVFEQGFDNLFYAAPAVADVHVLRRPLAGGRHGHEPHAPARHQDRRFLPPGRPRAEPLQLHHGRARVPRRGAVPGAGDGPVRALPHRALRRCRRRPRPPVEGPGATP